MIIAIFSRGTIVQKADNGNNTIIVHVDNSSNDNNDKLTYIVDIYIYIYAHTCAYVHVYVCIYIYIYTHSTMNK